MQSLIERLYVVFKPVVEGLGLSLVDVEWAGGRGGRRLGVYIARREGGVSLDDCTLVSRALEAVVEDDPDLSESFTLEISSPGLERVIRRIEEYDIFAGRTVALTLNEPYHGATTFEGCLQGLDGNGEAVSLDVLGELLAIPLERIKKAKLVFKFK